MWSQLKSFTHLVVSQKMHQLCRQTVISFISKSVSQRHVVKQSDNQTGRQTNSQSGHYHSDQISNSATQSLI